MSHVSDLQLEDLPGVQPHLISKLKGAGIQSVLELAVSVPHYGKYVYCQYFR